MMKKYVLFLLLAFFGLQAVPQEFGIFLSSIRNKTDKNMALTLTTQEGEKLTFQLPANKRTSIKQMLITRRTTLRPSAVLQMDPEAFDGSQLMSFSVHVLEGSIFISAWVQPLTTLFDKVSEFENLPENRPTGITIELESSKDKRLPITAVLKKVKIKKK